MVRLEDGLNPRNIQVIWEAYHKGVPLLGVPENPLRGAGEDPHRLYKPTGCGGKTLVKPTRFWGFFTHPPFLDVKKVWVYIYINVYLLYIYYI